jgi:Ca2+/Na+ antiporter
MGVPLEQQAYQENMWSGIGLIVSLCFFVWYIWFCFTSSDGSALQMKIIAEAIQKGDVNLTSAIIYNQEHQEELLDKILPAFFKKYDDDASKQIDRVEFVNVMKDLGVDVNNKEALDKEYAKANSDTKDEINLQEFKAYMKSYISNEVNMASMKAYNDKTSSVSKRELGKNILAGEDDDDDDEVELPEDLVDKSPEEQAWAMFTSAMYNMIVGTILVCLFANPAVDLFDEWGVKWGISSFYVGFLLAPFASNASELLVAYGMALKKSSKSVTMSFESLIGAACMNNTLCLAVFFALIYCRGLAWKFKAETLGILVIQWIMALIVLSGDTQRKAFGIAILMLYPLCLLIVWFCENELGWD